MKISRSSIKQHARMLLQDRFGFFASITLLMAVCDLFLTYLSALAVPRVDSLITLILELGSLLVINMIYTILRSGMMRIYLKRTDDEPYSYSDLLHTFRNHPEPAAVYSCISSALSYAGGSILSALFAASDTAFPAILAAGIAYAVLILWFELTFAFFLYVHLEKPYLSFKELMEKSALLIRGYRLNFLLMQLSFLGILLLGVLSFGIGMVFAIPYITMTETLYYKELSTKSDPDVRETL